MSGQIMWGKFAIWTTVIMAGGWGIMRWSMPTEEQFYNELSPELKRKVDAIRAQREGNTALRDKLELAGKEGQVVWADQFAPATKGGTGRKV